MTASLLPPNATKLERAIETAMARLADLPVPLRQLVSPDHCPLDLLPYLAWALSIDSWSSDWPEPVKRARVRRAIEIQRRKGTAESVRAVVESFGGAVALREWWQTTPRGEPHTFNLAVTLSGAGGTEASAAFADAVIAEVRRTKPVRSHFTYTQGVSFARKVGIVAAARPAIFARLSLDAPAA
ncbi:phage tail protein I [Sphingomonas sp. CBMAI 2297]|uniref:phage tail protein I n=1 Tax=Sphingomonas sp. CBMAI 2297 TaxID=2991720 RepID=UPI002455577F|nr:phage tail protein I [Sphingomonas sp. CBMAI 2297]MDH4743153.1 phage tail protein I [Sphingomonas sp. CBMAI 2297]